MFKKILIATLAMLPVSIICQPEPAKSSNAMQTLLAPNLMDTSEWKGKLQMGNEASDNEIYIVTDWLCGVCQRKEADLEQMLPKIFQNSRVYFIDLANHEGSADFVKYNVSFLVNNKKDYLKLRPIINKYSLTRTAPTQEQINKELASLNIKYIPLSDSQIKEINNYFTAVRTSLKVQGTPTVVLKNVKTNKMKSFVGPSFTEEDLLKSLEEIKKP